MIALRSVTLSSRVTGAPLLESVDLEVGEGQVALVAGPSGCGKTALIRLLSASARPDSGEVSVFGHDLARLRRSSLALLRRRAAFIPQEVVLLERESALVNAAASLSVAAVPRRDAHARAATALARFGLERVAAIPVARLSSGQRRRVCLARAAACEPQVIVADDPTAHLDADGRLAFLDLVVEMQGRGGAALVASSEPSMTSIAHKLGWQVLELGLVEEQSDVATPNVVPFPIARASSSRNSAGGAA